MPYAVNTARLHVALPDDLKQRLDETAERLGESSSELVRRAIARLLRDIDAEYAPHD